MKKYIIYSLVGLSSLMAGSCNSDLLDIENGNSMNTSTFWKTENDAIAGVNAVYAMFYRQGTWTRNIYTQMNGMADDGVSFAGWSELAEYAKFIFTDYNFSETNTKMYKEHYTAINRANQVLDNIDNIPFANEADREDIRSQAKFLRAYFYFYMTVLWDNLPLCLHTSSADDKPEQVDADTMFGLLEQDLEDAIPNLPLTRDSKNVGRITRGAAYGLLSKIYMQHHKWEDAKRTLQWLVEGEGSSLYSLVDDYSDNFNYKTEHNSESVFEINFSLVNYVGFDQTDNFLDSDAQLGTQIEMNQAPSGVGWGNIEARHWLVEYYKREKTVDGNYDRRLYHTLWYSDMYNDFPDDDTQMYKYLSWESSWGNNRVFIKKYSTDTHVASPYYWNSNNFRAIRYADILLLYAEALNELSATPPTKAVECVNRVRQRANLPTIENSTYYDGQQIMTSKDAFREHLKIERGLELALECVRWIDLKRWGIDNQATLDELRSRDEDFNNFVIGKSIRMPLPQIDCDNNPNMSQNPNY
jgi:hypothetical protein